MKRAPLLAVLLAGALLGGCSDDGDDDAGGADPTTTTTTTDASSTTSTDTTTSSSGGACSDPPNVTGPDEIETVHADADVDGDGRIDRVYSFHHFADGGPDDDGVRVQIELATGDVVVEDLDPAADPDGVKVATDLGLDGKAELWVHVGRGASTDIYQLYELDGCDLEPVQLGGGLAEFAIGGPVLLLQGVRCEDDGQITHLGATSEDGESFITLDLTYELQDGTLVGVDDTSRPLTRDDPELAAYSMFDC